MTDMPPAEGREWVALAREQGLDRVFMLAPTSSPERIASVAENASGFIYCQSRAGVTGYRNELPPDLGELISRVRSESPLPIAVGFGISTPAHVTQVIAVADGAIVGTALVRLVAEAGNDVASATMALASLTRSLKQATRQRS